MDDLWATINEALRESGVDLEALCGGPLDASRCKVVCVAPGLDESLSAMGKSPRDQVVMVRIDESTRESLDLWVETGVVKSRSEAAALFIREGLEVRAAELEELGDALKGVEEAKRRLQEKARKVIGPEASEQQ